MTGETVTVVGPCPACHRPAQLTVWVQSVAGSAGSTRFDPDTASIGGLVTAATHGRYTVCPGR